MDDQMRVNEVGQFFRERFGYTPLKERLHDILTEAIELSRSVGRPSMRDEAGDLLCSLLALMHEEELDPNILIDRCKEKIHSRKAQYNALGRKLKVALMGGAFNPPTQGHIAVAQLVLDFSREFDEVWLVPCNRHLYNKPGLGEVSPQDRVEMCQLATRHDGRIRVFPYEIEHGLSGEWYKFIKMLLEDPQYENYNFSTIIGMDNANTFDRWINSEHLEKIQRFVVVSRPGFEPKSDWYLHPPHIFMRAERDMPKCSSTDVRNILGMVWGNNLWSHLPESLTTIVDGSVLDYIREHSLYMPNLETDNG